MKKVQGKRAAGARAGLRGLKGQAVRRGGAVGKKKPSPEDRKAMAREVHAWAVKAKVPMRVDGEWVVFDGKVPTDLLMKCRGCESELADLVRGKKVKLPRALDKAVTKVLKERAARPAKAGTTLPGGRQRNRSRLQVGAPSPDAGGQRKAVPRVTGPEVPLEDGQWETFCLLMSQQRFSAKSCYAQVFPGSSEAAARSSASALLTKPNIRDRIEWLRKEAVKGFTCEKEELMRFLHAVVFTPVGHVDEESPLAQEVQWEEMQAGGAQGKLRRGDADSGNEETSDPVTIVKRKVKMPGKKECGELLARMQGWEKPKEVTLTMGYEPPSKALERAQEKGVDVMGILKKAGILTP